MGGFVFYDSFYEAIKELPPDDFKEITLAICEYALNGEEKELVGMNRSFFALIKPQLDANNKRRENGKYGSLGGRPKKPNGFTDENPMGLEEKPNGLSNENPKVKDKVKEKVKDKVKDKESITPTQTYGEFGNVFMTEDEMQKLSNVYGAINAKEYIEKLSYYLYNNPKKKYTSHYRTIINWIDRDKKDGIRQPARRYDPNAGMSSSETDWEAAFRDKLKAQERSYT